ncbi:hypothetical protein GCM10027596_39640 [Nocardioides korecus]
MTSPTQVTLLTQSDCAQCDHAKDVLARIADDYPLDLREIALETPEGQGLAAAHGILFAPGVLVDGHSFGFGRLSERRLRRELLRRTTTHDVER